MSPLPFALVLLAIFGGFIGKRKGRKVILWGIGSVISALLLSLLAFLLLSNFYPCNPDECCPANYGLSIGFAVTFLWIVLIPSKKK